VQQGRGRIIAMASPDAETDPGEFAALSEVADELGVPVTPLPSVRRTFVDVGDEQRVSALVWGDGPVQLALLHGGGQNAHTWDLVAMLLMQAGVQSLVALDLPGHGHSSWRPDRDYGPRRSAQAIATALDALAPSADGVVGMSLGGLTTLALAAARPDLLRRVVLVDVTPGAIEAFGAMTPTERGTVALIAGPHTYPTREEMVERAIAASPRRPASAVRRGVVHNTVQQPDGSWAWRYDARDPGRHHQEPLWDAVTALTMPALLVRGGDSRFTSDADVARMQELAPTLQVETVADSGHSVQSDQPRALADLIRGFVLG
jgi:esterase